MKRAGKRKKPSRVRSERKKRQSTPTTDRDKIKFIHAVCALITSKTGVKHVVDHIVPLALGGKHHQDNLQIITDAENKAKRAKHPIKFYGDEEYRKRAKDSANGIYYDTEYTFYDYIAGELREKERRQTEYVPPPLIAHAGERSRKKTVSKKVVNALLIAREYEDEQVHENDKEDTQNTDQQGG